MLCLSSCGAWSSRALLALLILLCLTAVVRAEEPKADTSAASKASEGPCALPLPLHMLEGSGGAFITESAYLVNPPPPGETVGLPAIGYIHVDFGDTRQMDVFSATWTLWDRLELGFAWDRFDTGDLYPQIELATGAKIDGWAINLMNFNARVQIFKENDFGTKWVPATTFGIHGKVNTDIDGVDSDLGGGLEALGIEDDKGVDFTLTATKTIDLGFRPVAWSATLRYTEAAYIGLLGFTGEWDLVFETNLCVPITGSIVAAAEYRMMPAEFDTIPGLLEGPDDWFTLAVAFIVTDQFTFSVGYGHFGELLNHTANNSWGVAVKFEF
jgi:hypothetical protein